MPTKNPAIMSVGQCTPAATLAIPIKIDAIKNQMPSRLFSKNKIPDKAKKKAACPEGKELELSFWIRGSKDKAKKGRG